MMYKRILLRLARNFERCFDRNDLIANELYRRLELIKQIEPLIENPKQKELEQLSELLEEGLWILHPRYEGTTRFRPNPDMNRSLIESLGIAGRHSENAEKRPRFVVLDDSILVTFTSDHYLKNSAFADGYDEVLLIELKHGNCEIGNGEKHLLSMYEHNLLDNDDVCEKTKITGYVLGTSITEDKTETFTCGNLRVIPRQYDLSVTAAKKRTADLLGKIHTEKTISDG